MPASIRVNVNEPSHSLDRFYGVFFEDISNSADGGLYGELIRNRSFEFSPADDPHYHSHTGWEVVEEGGARVVACAMTKDPLTAENPHYLVLSAEKPGTKMGIRSLGYYTGIPVKGGEEYHLVFCIRTQNLPDITVTLEKAGGGAHLEKTFPLVAGGWQELKWDFVAPETDPHATLLFSVSKTGKFHMDHVSLFPENTYRNEKNGLRCDLATAIADLSPKFMRFPGGCVAHLGSVDPDDPNAIYRWKQTIGDVKHRPPKSVHWRGHQTRGIGYYEYFRYCEDMGAEAIPVLSVGYDPHTKICVPIDELGPWIDDALDLIEFANGAVDTEWGAVRAELGHPEPFCLKYISIGNEEMGEAFWDRYDLFHAAIREKHPEILIINNASYNLSGEFYYYGWENARKNGSDLVDEHYYVKPEWMLTHCRNYDTYDRSGPRVFVGEYASFGNTYFHALSEAAYMVHMEENSDLVKLACYAPLLCSVHNPQWRANLIYFDQYRMYGTPNYYVQHMFGNGTGNRLLKIETEGLAYLTDITVPAFPDEEEGEHVIQAEAVHVTASLDEKDGAVLLKVVNVSGEEVKVNLFLGSDCRGTVRELKGFDKLAVNTLDAPETVVPAERDVEIPDGAEYAFAPESISVFRLYKV